MTAVRLLNYLLRETLNGVTKITPYHIASAVLDITENFDAHSDSIVRVQSSRLRNLLTSYYDNEGRDDPWRISLPKGQYNLELEPGTHDNTHFGVSIAVLPLLGSDDEIADGMTQEIIYALSQSSELRLIAPDTIFQFRERASEAVAVGKSLNVDFVLNGSLNISINTIRVGLKLTDVAASQVKWSNTYDFEKSPENFEKILEDSAYRITAALLGPGGKIDRLSRGKPQKFSSYAAVLKHYRHIETYTPESHREAREALEQAVKDSPNYAEAWACLGGIYGNEYMFGFNEEKSAPPALERALFACKRAVQLSPECVMGQYGLALSYYYLREKELFHDAANRALEFAPYRADLNASLGLHLAYEGEWERGLQMLDKARWLNPLHPSWYWYPYAADACRRHDFNQAFIYSGRLSMPNFFWDHLFMATMLGHLGRHERAHSALTRSIELNPAIQTSCREIIGKIFHDEPLIELFLEGLTKAGLTAQA